MIISKNKRSCQLPDNWPSFHCFGFTTETHINRQATRHNCLPRFLGNRDKWSEIVYSEGKHIFVLGSLEQPRQEKNLLYRQDKPNKPSKEGPLPNSPWVPIWLQFQQSAGATSLYSLYKWKGLEQSPAEPYFLSIINHLSSCKNTVHISDHATRTPICNKGLGA